MRINSSGSGFRATSHSSTPAGKKITWKDGAATIYFIVKYRFFD